MKNRSEEEREAARQAAVDAAAKRSGVKGNGWLVKRGKFWVACWKYNGKLHKRTTKETTETRAKEKLVEFVAPYRAAKVGADAKHEIEDLAAKNARREVAHLPVLKLADAFEKFRTTTTARHSAPNTLEGKRQMLKQLVAWNDSRRDAYAGAEMRDLKPSDVRVFLEAKRTKGTTMQTCANFIGAMKVVWQAIMDEERKRQNEGVIAPVGSLPDAKIAYNPWEAVQEDFSRKARAANAKTDDSARRLKREAFTLDEMRRIFATAEGELLTLFQIGALVGCRLGDAATLKWGENVLLDKGETGRLVYEPRKTSTSSGISVVKALGERLHAILAALPGEKRRGEFVLPQCAADYLNRPTDLSHKVQRVIERAGIETKVAVSGAKRRRTIKGFHSLRYSYVSIRANRGEDLEDIRAEVGHTSTAMTSQYVEKDDATHEREAAQVSDFFDEGKKAVKRPSGVFAVRAGEVGRADVEDAQKPVFDAVCAMLGGLEAETLKAVASEALRLAMAKSVIGARAAS